MSCDCECDLQMETVDLVSDNLVRAKLSPGLVNTFGATLTGLMETMVQKKRSFGPLLLVLGSLLEELRGLFLRWQGLRMPWESSLRARTPSTMPGQQLWWPRR